MDTHNNIKFCYYFRSASSAAKSPRIMKNRQTSKQITKEATARKKQKNWKGWVVSINRETEKNNVLMVYAIALQQQQQ